MTASTLAVAGDPPSLCEKLVFNRVPLETVGKPIEDKKLSEKPPRFLRLPEVENRTGLRQTALYELEVQGRFPKRVKLSARAAGWVESEVEEWIAGRIAASRRGPRPGDQPLSAPPPKRNAVAPASLKKSSRATASASR
jgi:prophage regulatory protein